MFTIQGYKPSPRGPDHSFSRWRRCYKSRGSFTVYLALEVQERSNPPVLGQTLATKVSKSHAIPPYVPGVNPLGWPLISALVFTSTGSMREECKRYHNRLAELVAGKKGENCAITISWICSKVSFAILRSALHCLIPHSHQLNMFN